MNEDAEFNPIEKISDFGGEHISAGTLLRNAREAEGLLLKDLAITLKVPLKKLEALEADLFDSLPDAVFTRALAASVCRTLKIDSALILDRLPNSDRQNLKTDQLGINTPFRSAGDRNSLLFFRQYLKPVNIIVLVFLLGALAMFFSPAAPLAEFVLSTSSDEQNSLLPLIAAEVTPKQGATLRSEKATEPEQSTLVHSASLNSNLDSTVLDTPALAVTADKGASIPALTASDARLSGLLVFTARGTSWVEVLDMQGAVLVRKTIHGGEVITASGALPLSVVVGRADVTDVQVRGKPFDLFHISKDNVARFEVK